MEADAVIDSNWDEVTENFDDMNLRDELLRGVYAYGFENRLLFNKGLLFLV